MGKNGNKKKSSALSSGFHQRPISLREEISGRKQLKGGGGSFNNVKSILKMQHLQNLALWAGGEASIPSLGALFGHNLATYGEAVGIPLDPSLFPCQRCESILQPGYNCTVRIEKTRAKVRGRRKKSSIPTQNNVVYTCHFCSSRNLKRGTPKGHMKDILASKPKPVSELKPVCSTNEAAACSLRTIESCMEINNTEIVPLQSISVLESKSNDAVIHPIPAKEIPIEKGPATPTEGMRMTLSEGKRRKKSGSGANKQVGTENVSATMDAENAVSGSSRKRRKSWSSLKEIAENRERANSHNITNLTIPFFI